MRPDTTRQPCHISEKHRCKWQNCGVNGTLVRSKRRCDDANDSVEALGHLVSLKGSLRATIDISIARILEAAGLAPWLRFLFGKRGSFTSSLPRPAWGAACQAPNGWWNCCTGCHRNNGASRGRPVTSPRLLASPKEAPRCFDRETAVD